MENNKLFVNNMPFETKEEEIRALFEEFGEITELKMITDRATGRFRGFCFITYATEESAMAAKEAMVGKKLNDREIFVEIAKPQTDRDSSRGNRPFRQRY